MNQPLQETEQRYALNENMIRSIARTGPWIRFFSILGFISVGFMLLGGIVMAFIVVIGGSLSREPGMLMMLPLSVLYVLLAVVYIFPSLYLWQTASAVVRLKQGMVVAGMETALEKQRRFWKFIGIVTIAFIALYPIFVLAMVFAGMM